MYNVNLLINAYKLRLSSIFKNVNAPQKLTIFLKKQCKLEFKKKQRTNVENYSQFCVHEHCKKM